MANPNIKDYGFGKRTKEFDDLARDKARGVLRPRVWTREKCCYELDCILTLLKKVLKDDEKVEKNNPQKLKNETIRDSITLMNKVLDYLKYLYPPVQTNVNMNLETTADKVIERLIAFKEKKKKNEIIIVGEENDT